MALRLLLITLGFVAGFLVFGLSLISQSSSTDASRDKDRFQIVDEYKNCHVVRYSPRSAATYKYFLHCSTPQ
jgi:hypothetical protein